MTPIALESLTDLGFTKKKFLKDHYFLEVNKHSVAFSFEDGQLQLNSSHPVKPFEYVEQLQAWYLSITFKELPINTD